MLQFGGDVGPPRPGVAGVNGTEELVGLKDQFAAQTVLVVDDERAHAGLAQFQGRREPCWPSADDQALHLERLDGLHLGHGVDIGQDRLPVQRLDPRPRPYGDHAGLDGQAIDHHQALGTLAVGAEDTLGRAVLVVMAEDAHPVGKEGRGDGILLTGTHRLALPVELETRALLHREDGMFTNAVIRHAAPPCHE